jgi:hypothetical protein
LSEQEDDGLGPISALANVPQVTKDILDMLSYLFIDYQPNDEDNQRAVFVYAATISDEDADDEEADDEDRENGVRPAERQLPRWEIEISCDDAERIAGILVASNARPDTQIMGPSHLEMLVRNETTHSFLLPPPDKKIVTEFAVGGKRLTATVGVPTVELLIRCAIRRKGLQRLELFDSAKLYSGLSDQEIRRALTDRTEDRISALKLLKHMARSGMLSICISSESATTARELEQLATAYRVRLAYEASIVYAPVLDVNRLDGTLLQPSLVRQRSARASEFVQAIGKGKATGFMGDRLLGDPTLVDEESSLRYLRAVAARDPFSAFMGYYQVLEYGMNEAWFDDLSKELKQWASCWRAQKTTYQRPRSRPRRHWA